VPPSFFFSSEWGCPASCAATSQLTHKKIYRPHLGVPEQIFSRHSPDEDPASSPLPPPHPLSPFPGEGKGLGPCRSFPLV